MNELMTRRNLSPVRSIFDGFFNESFLDDAFFGQNTSTPSVNVRENESEFMVEVAAPGYKKDSFNIQVVENNYLLISGSSQTSTQEQPNQNQSSDKSNESQKNHRSRSSKYHRKEFSYSSFERSLSLPQDVNLEDIKATYTDGILNITIPKKEKSQKISRMIEIQ